ncbi:hypothetical protein EW026_g6745 [Hermanssonia centrifuga]|uniref:C2H2-type domain-containing protein n=1 Tax=Hermanssonia centrifuga TaxID=98765 RepID=A0A4V3X9M5_9APHY|nr:hypothetical protein EW026_g6745 [Hermanssonia centrifuga]
MPRTTTYNVLWFDCPQCARSFSTQGGLKKHKNSTHKQTQYAPPSLPSGSGARDDEFPEGAQEFEEDDSEAVPHAVPESRQYHPILNTVPCDQDGKPVPENSPPAALRPSNVQDNDWKPFSGRIAFELGEFLYKEEQMSQQKISKLLELWAASLLEHGGAPPFASQQHMYDTIDAITVGDVPWTTFSLKYLGEVPDGTIPSWMQADYKIHFRDPHLLAHQQLNNPGFKDGFDPIPRRDFDCNGNQVYNDFMSGNWSWKQADLLAQDENNCGAMVVPLIFGSDKTTVSVATGQNDYYPLYMSSGAITNAYRRAHCDSVVPMAFLATPKSGRKYDKDPVFQKFRWQLFHKSLVFVMQSIKPGMTTKHLVQCPDGHYRYVLYCLGPYIADYPEQALLAGIPFTNDFPRADIHKLIAPDLLHQIIKGTFKDHLVTWVGEYLTITHGETAGNAILDDIDRRIAAAPPFPGLCRFPEGRRFKQWTGDDSKALMKVYLSAIAGHIPDEMVQAIAAFLEFCYFVRRPIINQETLHKIEDALARFHMHRRIFETTGVRTTFSLPRQHSMKHYTWAIRQFGAPNGLCTSITESRHITAVKEPWRRSNRHEAIGQMLTINERLHKLGAARADFEEHGMLKGNVLSATTKALLQAHSESDQEDAENEDDDSHLAELPVRAAVDNDIIGEPMEQASLPPEDDGTPVDGKRVVGFVDMALTPQRRYPRTLLSVPFGMCDIFTAPAT